jgi:hypothetical protein
MPRVQYTVRFTTVALGFGAARSSAMRWKGGGVRLERLLLRFHQCCEPKLEPHLDGAGFEKIILYSLLL